MKCENAINTNDIKNIVEQSIIFCMPINIPQTILRTVPTTDNKPNKNCACFIGTPFDRACSTYKGNYKKLKIKQ